MKQLNTITLFAPLYILCSLLLSLMSTSGRLNAQNNRWEQSYHTNDIADGGEPFVTLTVREDEEISLKMLGIAEDTPVTIDPGDGSLSTYSIAKQPTGWNVLSSP